MPFLRNFLLFPDRGTFGAAAISGSQACQENFFISSGLGLPAKTRIYFGPGSSAGYLGAIQDAVFFFQGGLDWTLSGGPAADSFITKFVPAKSMTFEVPALGWFLMNSARSSPVRFLRPWGRTYSASIRSAAAQRAPETHAALFPGRGGRGRKPLGGQALWRTFREDTAKAGRPCGNAREPPRKFWEEGMVPPTIDCGVLGEKGIVEGGERFIVRAGFL